MRSNRGLMRHLRHLRKHWRLQREAPLNASWARRIDMLQRGVRYDSYALYPEDGEYLTDIARVNAHFMTNKHVVRNVLKDKHKFSLEYSERFPIPPILGILRDGTLKLLHGPLDPWWEQGDLIARPLGGKKGEGVVRLKRGDPFPTSPTPLLLTPFIQPAAYAAKIAPHCGNTIRVLTLRDEVGPFVGRAVHRFGTRETAPTDNWSLGGLCAKVDLETGVLGKAVKHPTHTNGVLRWVERHPDTDALIEGTIVPRWPQIQAELLRTLDDLPEFVEVGWDILITNESFWVIEGNLDPGFSSLQVHGSLLKDDRVKAFYKSHNII